jgi:hypothetical protein
LDRVTMQNPQGDASAGEEVNSDEAEELPSLEN